MEKVAQKPKAFKMELLVHVSVSSVLTGFGFCA